ncbi:MAG TPA: hypothetical protein VLJ61_19515 [Pyrinomonadaceae bacterium]|nr:hypothetical protein [Pyrinomonadaceae bacterium]
MNFPAFRTLLPRAAALVFCAFILAPCAAFAQQQQAPMSNAEFLSVVRQLPQHPNLRAQLIEDIRRRGIGFTLTSGLRSFVATKSGGDEELRRVLEEAERRFLNPKSAPTLPSESESADVLSKTREATLDALDQMPDFVVKQLVTRAHALGRTQNWTVEDHLIVGVSYRAREGEKYRLLATNGVAGVAQAEEKSDYREAGGTNSRGEFATMLKSLFAEDSHTEFKPLDTDTLRGRPTIVYEYNIKKVNSDFMIETEERSTIAANRGKVWIDREKMRVLRIESEAYDLPSDFPVTSSTVAIDYDWVTISGQGEYLLPSHSVLIMTRADRDQVVQFRNDIRFRNYQKFGTELKIIEDDDVVDDAPPDKPQPQPQKPPEKKP